MSIIPLIYTTKGNLPVEELEHGVEWRIDSEYVIFIETYRLAGEVVKQSSHVKLLTGLSAVGDTSI